MPDPVLASEKKAMTPDLNRDSARRQAAASIDALQRAASRLLDETFDELWRGFEMLRATFERGNHLHVCGNGGSAADAQHFVTEMVVRLDAHSRRRALPATALSTDTSILTAAANDYGFEQVFARQIEARANSGDLVLLISTSGNSPNMLAAAAAARKRLAGTLALIGKDGGHLKPLVDCAVVAPSDSTQRIQEIHTLCLHLWCEWLDPVFS
ncbi:MAG TPA: SIS domain-containing protein [Acidobacteriota bacterium]|nr:SIS domain-containing protein [Acidobacteriota bacterium]